MAGHLSSNMLVHKIRNFTTGEITLANDILESYYWIRDNTEADARILTWWDYGYHINAIAERTSLADGNTWNHEHIALIGKVLVSPEEEAHEIARHLADYVLVWTARHAGLPSDDLGKSPHMARIAGSVFADV